MSDLSEYRERVAEVLWGRFGFPTGIEWEELPTEDRDDWRRDADALLAPGGVVAEIVAGVERERDDFKLEFLTTDAIVTRLMHRLSRVEALADKWESGRCEDLRDAAVALHAALADERGPA
jgi:hypothetical protein